MSLAILLFFIAIIVATCYYLRQWFFWKIRGVPGPLGLPFIGNQWDMLQTRPSPYIEFVAKCTKKYGKVFGITEGLTNLLIVSEPDMIHEIFIKQYDNFYGRRLYNLMADVETSPRVHLFVAQGHRWKRLRALSSSSFSNNSLRKLKNTIEDCSLELMKHIDDRTSNGQQIDVLEFYQEFTLDVIGRIAMGQHKSKMFENPLVDDVRGVFQNDQCFVYLLAGAFPMLVPILRGMFMRFPKLFGGTAYVNMIVACEKAVRTRIHQRESDLMNGIENQEPADFIDMFLDARTDSLEHENSNFTISEAKVNRKLTVKEIVAQCMMFLIAGFDTTALSLSYTSFLLATHPEIQKKVQEEMNRECPDPEVTFDQLSKLKYLDCVIRETLRLYPLGAMATARKCMRSTEVCGLPIEAGTEILVDTWSLHHDADIWGDDVDEFKPERWLNVNDVAHKGAYIPFGYGPRQCIGMRLAYMEERLLLTHILRKYSFTTGPKTQIPLKLIGRDTIQPESVFLHLEERP
ncbi:unnamed protein product [Caenorhabditis bovis]|uniref:Cytochrome P450 n=1 Tax=Caenorhabditis bovis TaxID=2654633 RepID=A0A8S1EXC7_9PELO|nr:unnamed protein product [Caenorhabditis bovis]